MEEERIITLSDGYELIIDKECLDDVELMDMIFSMKSDKESALGSLTQIFTSILGEDQRKALWEHLRTAKGRVKISKLNDILPEIFEQLGKKN